MPELIINKHITIDTRKRNPMHISLCHPYLWQRVLEDNTTHGKKVASHKNVVLQKNVAYLLKEQCHKQRDINAKRCKEEVDENSQGGAAGFPGTYPRKQKVNNNIIAMGQIECERGRAKP